MLGPHVEDLAREWTRRFAAATTLGGPVGIVGQAVLNDPAGRATHEVDVIALAEGEQLHAKRTVIRAVGEAKARLLLFSRTGFTDGLREAARTRADVELVDLVRLYTGD